jgi:hypothetical protein
MKNPNQIEHDYFQWLISQVHIGNSNSYNGLFQRMHELEFVWFVPNDDNRVQDGLDLRAEFLNGARYRFEQGVSVLEILIALSRRTAFTAGGTPEMWAWHLIENLGLKKASDPLTRAKAARIDDTLQALIWRTYERDGQGGFFPLRDSHEDQTKVEIWYQMNAYVNEIVEFEDA